MSPRARTWVVYVTVLLLFVVGLWGVLAMGSRLPPAAGGVGAPAAAGTPAGAADGSWWLPFLHRLQEPLPSLLLQIVVMVGVGRAVGALFARWGQPSVVGEMVAGLLLGPSLAGWLIPAVQGFVFPTATLGPLRMLSQIGVVLFMFVVGIDLDVDHLRRKADAALLVSHVSMLFPFLLGAGTALLAYRTMAPAGVGFPAFALFLGISMSITAFPVMARILEERQMSRTLVGTTALASAAIDDATAWCALALVVAIVQANGLAAAGVTVALTVGYALVMFFLLKPAASFLFGSRTGEIARHPRRLVAGVLLMVFVSALVTEVIGIHALFGAFLAGVVMPADESLRRLLKERLETFAGVFLLPLFFGMTGLRTEVGLLGDLAGWLLCLGFVAVAVIGKLGGSTLAARWTGLSWLDAFAVGSLMNTRGLVELIVLNIGYDLGILSPRIFTMLVLMALTTTVMTGPLLTLTERWRPRSVPASAR